MMRALKEAGVRLPYQKGRFDIITESECQGPSERKDDGSDQV